jgi:integrase
VTARRSSFAGAQWRDTGYVFTSTIGTPLDDRNTLRTFKGLLKAAKLPQIRQHDLRHTCVSLLGAQGVSMRVISEIVGHTEIRLTEKVYRHVFKPEKKAAAVTMDNALRGSHYLSSSPGCCQTGFTGDC